MESNKYSGITLSLLLVLFVGLKLAGVISWSWSGGISDLRVELNTGDYVIIDFKSAKDVYYSQFVQCAIYGIMIEENVS